VIEKNASTYFILKKASLKIIYYRKRYSEVYLLIEKKPLKQINFGKVSMQTSGKSSRKEETL
jgi:hypothetical protein